MGTGLSLWEQIPNNDILLVVGILVGAACSFHRLLGLILFGSCAALFVSFSQKDTAALALSDLLLGTVLAFLGIALIRAFAKLLLSSLRTAAIAGAFLVVLGLAFPGWSTIFGGAETTAESSGPAWHQNWEAALKNLANIKVNLNTVAASMKDILGQSALPPEVVAASQTVLSDWGQAATHPQVRTGRAEHTEHREAFRPSETYQHQELSDSYSDVNAASWSWQPIHFVSLTADCFSRSEMVEF